MGKASSSKKVARAAGIGGGRAHRRQTPWGYFGIIALIAILGLIGTWTSRDRRLNQINNAGETAPAVGTVWHEGYAVYACGKFLDPISTKAPDPSGVTTRTAGIIDIAPKVKSVAGKNATLGKFANAVGMTLNAAELQVPGGKLYHDGDKCGDQVGHVYVKQFAYAGDTVGQLYNGKPHQLPKVDPIDVPLADQQLITIAFVPASDAAKIPPPPKSVNDELDKLAKSASTATTVAPPAPPTTAPPGTAPATSTTAKK